MSDEETLSQTVNRLNAQGYTEDFQVKNNKFYLSAKKLFINPIDVVIDETARFEGDTNLNDESIVFALRDPVSGFKGTYVIGYSTNMDPADMDIIHQLKMK
ncbi:MAG: hypothetical protein O2897_00605 [bacterium]|nr:hypothetical protein [bacterium]